MIFLNNSLLSAHKMPICRVFSIQKVGLNNIGQMREQITKYLNLTYSELYIGHCFRRSATILVDNGGDVTSLRRHGRWKSTTLAKGCKFQHSQLLQIFYQRVKSCYYKLGHSVDRTHYLKHKG